MKILSFNILADVLANCGNFTKLYPNNAHLLKWDNRFPMIVNIITSYDPDIFCLAECNHYDQFQHEFNKRGYDSVYSQKESNNPHDVFRDFGDNFGKVSKETKDFFDDKWLHTHMLEHQLGDGVAIFYKKIKFNYKFSSLHSSNPVSAHIILNDKVTNHSITVTMTHMKSKKENHEIRMKQLETIFNRIDDMESVFNHALTDGARAIICGDFNADDQEMTPLEVLKRGYISVYGQKECSDYTNANGEHVKLLPAWTTYKWRGPPDICGRQKNEVIGLDSHVIDYIFIKGMKVTNTLDTDPNIIMMDDEDVGIPNKNYPSDHIAIGATLNF